MSISKLLWHAEKNWQTFFSKNYLVIWKSKLKSAENFKSKSTQNPEQHRIISESSFLASSVMLTPMIWSSCLSRQRTPLLLKQAEGGSSITYGSSSRNETLTNLFSGMPSGGLRAFPGQTISLMSIFPMDTKVIISKSSYLLRTTKWPKVFHLITAAEAKMQERNMAH